MSSQTQMSAEASTSTKQLEASASSQQSRRRLTSRQITNKRLKRDTLLLSTSGFSVNPSAEWDLEPLQTSNDKSMPELLTQRNVPNYAATAATTENNLNEPTNEAVALEIISDLLDANLPNTQVDAQGVYVLEEGSDNSQ